MHIVSISDIHIKNKDDYGYKLFIDFLNNSETQSAKKIFLLGDIFDFMTGSNAGYLVKFSQIFQKIASLIKNNIEIYYFEGNHDFNLEPLFKLIIEKYNLDKDKIHFYKSGEIINLWKKKFYFCHGDVLGEDSKSGEFTRKILYSKPVSLATEFLPFDVTDKIGLLTSELSYLARKKKNVDYSILRDMYRERAKETIEKVNCEFLICGHTHILENYELNFNGKKCHYINVGSPRENNFFMKIENGDVSFIRL